MSLQLNTYGIRGGKCDSASAYVSISKSKLWKPSKITGIFPDVHDWLIMNILQPNINAISIVYFKKIGENERWGRDEPSRVSDRVIHRQQLSSFNNQE